MYKCRKRFRHIKSPEKMSFSMNNARKMPEQEFAHFPGIVHVTCRRCPGVIQTESGYIQLIELPKNTPIYNL
jgi:hypothetical protein